MKDLSDDVLRRLRRVLAPDEPAHERYQVRRRLGEGGMGVVYLVHDVELDRPAAMKVLRDTPGAADSEQRMRREARVVARLEHPGIAPVHDVGRLADGRLFYVMKWVRGQRLDAWAVERESLVEKLRVFERICETVAFAHAHGVIHRDLKPQNVMVGDFGEVLVLDWGIARVRADSCPDPRADAPPPRLAPSAADESDTRTARTAAGAVMGTPAYMAPEQARGEIDQVDERSDVYALGAILFTMLAGFPPPRAVGDNAPRLPRGDAGTRRAPRALEAIVRKALAPDRGDRYASVSELRRDVTRFLEHRSPAAYREPPLEAAIRLARKFRTPILLVAAYLLVRALALLL